MKASIFDALSAKKNYAEFDLNLAFICAHLSDIVYYDERIQKKSLLSLGFDDIKVVSADNAKATVCKYQTDLFLIIEGTDFTNGEDLIDNANLGWVTEGAGKVHEGYKSHIDKIWKDILSELSVRTYENVIVAGHSMGGACGQIVNYRLNKSLGYHFGSPRVVDKKIKNDLVGRVFNVRNKFDVVSEIPPACLGYKLGGDVFTLHKHGIVKKNPKISDCLKSLFYTILYYTMKICNKVTGLKNKFRNLIASNHEIEHYINNISLLIHKRTD